MLITIIDERKCNNAFLIKHENPTRKYIILVMKQRYEG
jgi:hypothetical protein